MSPYNNSFLYKNRYCSLLMNRDNNSLLSVLKILLSIVQLLCALVITYPSTIDIVIITPTHVDIVMYQVDIIRHP